MAKELVVIRMENRLASQSGERIETIYDVSDVVSPGKVEAALNEAVAEWGEVTETSPTHRVARRESVSKTFGPVVETLYVYADLPE